MKLYRKPIPIYKFGDNLKESGSPERRAFHLLTQKTKDMKEIEILKEQVYNQGLNILLKRMEILLPVRQLKSLAEPTVVSAEITDMEEVVKTIKSEYTCFGIKDVKLDMSRQAVSFKIYGTCYIPEKYKGYIVLDKAWSATQTDECNYLNTIKEEHAEENTMPITAFTNGIKVEIV